LATFVLVHGAWHGGWCWKRVTPLLRAAGHEVYAPTLTGLGERAHLLSRDVNLDTHIADIVNILDYEELTDVILVGHSYAGIVIAGVAAKRPERLAHLVYLDAFVASDGQCLLDLHTPESTTAIQARVLAEGEGWRLPPAPGARFGVADEIDGAWLASRLGPQPYATFTQPLCLGAAPPPAATYILCTEPGGFRRHAERVRDAPGWRYRELATGHDAMVTQPRELTDLLLEVAALA
jgi:pimeloyl-ACP methyl ester carboxylesterase